MVENNVKKVIVAMSGGVDSSVAAALLKKAGFDVTGIFMKFWTDEESFASAGFENRCCSSEAEKRARKVAAKLKIPFYVLNFEKEFKKKIVDYFLKEQKSNNTPNPCVICNKEIKFGLLLEKALKLEAAFVATGHYARLEKDVKNSGGKSKLLKAKDKSKDQSYFLWMLDQNQLKRILFPLGDYSKKEVRNLAEKLRLPTRSTPDSQEICFIATTVNDFLEKYIGRKPGVIADREGKIIGEHRGLFFYTIGQRKGINSPQGPYYVFDKNFNDNILIVTKNKKDLLKKELICEKVNWASGAEPVIPLKIKAKIRYGHMASPATIKRAPRNKTGRNYAVIFNKAQAAITPGQSIVFYKGEELLGGGIISNIFCLGRLR